MQLLSFTYVAFVAVLFIAQLRLSRPGQNALLLCGSLVFCASWDYRSALVLMVTTAIDFELAKRLQWEEPERKRRQMMWLSVALNVSVLAFIKYARLWNSPSFVGAVGVFRETHSIIVPIGLSFYTLARLTYTLDVFYRILRPTRSLTEFALFVACFPQLVSGPIERAVNILPQLAKRRTFDQGKFHEGLWLITLGLFKKVYIADHCGILTKHLFQSDARTNGAAVLLGVYAYAIQIYCDFAGYSDIARGTARLFGIEVTQNFNAPYSSTNLSEYWKRWHVSLSSFLEDYVNGPVAMTLRKYGTVGIVIAIWVTFVISGLWHGTGWTFLVWGCVHAFGLTALALSRKLRKRIKSTLPPRLWNTIAWFATFHYVCFGYLFFRAPSLNDALGSLHALGRHFAFSPNVRHDWRPVLFFASLSFLLDRLGQRRGGTFGIFQQRTWVRAVCYAIVLLCIIRLFAPSEVFIYAEF